MSCGFSLRTLRLCEENVLGVYPLGFLNLFDSMAGTTWNRSPDDPVIRYLEKSARFRIFVDGHDDLGTLHAHPDAGSAPRNPHGQVTFLGGPNGPVPSYPPWRSIGSHPLSQIGRERRQPPAPRAASASFWTIRNIFSASLNSPPLNPTTDDLPPRLNPTGSRVCDFTKNSFGRLRGGILRGNPGFGPANVSRPPWSRPFHC